MSVYPPTGSGGAHMDKAISGGKKGAAKKTPVKKATGDSSKSTGSKVTKKAK